MAKSVGKPNGKQVNTADILNALKKYYFWGVVPILVLVAFFLKSGAQKTVKTTYDSETSAIDNSLKSMQTISGNKKHPTQKTVEAIAAEDAALSKNVYETWELMYNEQKRRNKWPRRLSREFLDIVENAKFESPIGVGKPYVLEDYADMMSSNLPQLLIDVNRRRYQVRCYQFVPGDGTGSFEPVYILPNEDPNSAADPILYLFGPAGESGEVTVYQYFESKGYIDEVRESTLRTKLLGIPKEERRDYWVETDPMITDPNNYVTSKTSGAMPGMMPGMMPGGLPAVKAGGGNTGNEPIPGEGVDPALTNFNPSGYDFTGTDSATGYPGLPLLQDRSRQVGNVDWPNPEIFELLSWTGTVPKSIEVWYLQEDLWVYQAILRVVMRSNGILSDAVLQGTANGIQTEISEPKSDQAEDPRSSAANNIGKSAIKCIEGILIGQKAASAWSTIKGLSLIGFNPNGEAGAPMMMPGMPGMPGGMPPMPGGMPGMPGGMPPMPMPMPAAGGAGPGMTPNAAAAGADLTTETGIRASLKEGRYLDGAEEPLKADDSPPFAEFKRMPVVMKLVVDQRRIPEILINCANCSMPIDVRHVRIAPDKAGIGVGRGSDSGTDSNQSSGGVSLGRSALGEMSGYGSDAIRIEIYGIINIFNAPDPALLGTGQADEGKKAKGGVSGVPNVPGTPNLPGAGAPPAETPAAPSADGGEVVPSETETPAAAAESPVGVETPASAEPVPAAAPAESAPPAE